MYRLGVWMLGGQAHRILRPIGLALAVVAAGTMVAAFLIVQRHEHRLQAEADRCSSIHGARNWMPTTPSLLNIPSLERGLPLMNSDMRSG